MPLGPLLLVPAPLLRQDPVFQVAPRSVIKGMHLRTRIGVMMGVRVGQVSGTFDTPHGIEPANHMSAIENGGDIKFRAIYLCRLGDARVYLPAWTLEAKKGGAAVDVYARYAAKATGSAHDNAEILVSELEGPFRRRSLDLHEVARVLK